MDTVRCRTGSTPSSHRAALSIRSPATKAVAASRTKRCGSSCSDQAPKPRPPRRLPIPYGPRTPLAATAARIIVESELTDWALAPQGSVAELGLAARHRHSRPTPKSSPKSRPGRRCTAARVGGPCGRSASTRWRRCRPAALPIRCWLARWPRAGRMPAAKSASS